VTWILLALGLGLGVFAGATLLLSPRPLAPPRTLRELHRLAAGGVLDGQRCQVSGTVRGTGDQLTAPLSGKPCLGYTVEVDAGDASEPVAISAGVTCALEADEVTAQLAAGDGRVHTSRPVAEGSLAQLRSDAPTWWATFGDRLEACEETARVREWLFAGGDDVIVACFAIAESDPDAPPASDNRAPVKRVFLRSAPDIPLHIADTQQGLRDG